MYIDHLWIFIKLLPSNKIAADNRFSNIKTDYGNLTTGTETEKRRKGDEVILYRPEDETKDGIQFASFLA
jgi:hypothetical protein